jgi:hypothetical protein
MVNGYSLSWFLYVLFACAAADRRSASRVTAAAVGPGPASPALRLG